MKISLKKFILTFILTAFLFQFASNAILGPEIALFPSDGNWYPGLDSDVEWKKTMSHILQPVKFVLLEPLSFLGQDPDPAPPLLLLSYALYWSVLAAIFYALIFLLQRLFRQN